jgi:hypothetical protein
MEAAFIFLDRINISVAVADQPRNTVWEIGTWDGYSLRSLSAMPVSSFRPVFLLLEYFAGASQLHARPCFHPVYPVR